MLPASVRQTGLYRGDPAPHVLGTYNGQLTAAVPFYLTAYGAAFFIYPLAEHGTAPGAAGGQEAMLTLNVRPIGSNVRLDLVVNEQTVASQDLVASHAGTAWAVPVKFHDGMNSVRVIGHGTPLANAKLGPLLFILGEPRWTLADPAHAAVAAR